MSLKRYEFLEHTADVKFRAYGLTEEEMLANAAQALFQSMIDISTVSAKECWNVEIAAPDLERLAYEWLCELIYLFDVESAVFSLFDITLRKGGTWGLEAAVCGERIDRSKHSFYCQAKAVTLHEFEVRKNDHWSLQAVVDV